MGEQNQSKSQKTKQQTKTKISKVSNKSISIRKTAKSATAEQTSFAAGLSFKKLFFIFIIGSIFGTIYEDILIYLMTGEFMLHRGVIYGPFNVIYGFGAALMCWLLLRKKYTNRQIFLFSALAGGIIEYVLSLLQELITGTISWDYSQQLLNIDGRTTIPIMIVWGFMGLALIKYIYPFFSRLIEKIPNRIGNPLFWGLFIFMIFDCLISWSAVIRQSLRHNNVPPFTPIGEFYDEHYTDEYLRHYYPNMQRTEEEK